MGAVARSLRLHGGLPPGIATALSNGLSVKIQMKDAPDISGGGTVSAGAGFQLVDSINQPVKDEVTLEFAVFDDQYGATLAANATLATPTKGSIRTGSGTAALVVTTDANGEFECSVTNLADETVYLLCKEGFRSIGLDCSDIDSITYSS